MFLEKDKPFKLPEVEEEVLKFWDKEQIFEKSLVRRKGKKPFVFYEGPPYANGRPGIHHVLARTYKDIILRFRSMRGYYVPRRAGWDTHGLPVEIAAEKALGLKSKKDIEKFGIELFNQKAKEAVWLYKDEWEALTNRIGYWLDLKNAYITYENEYIESLWWILKKLSDKKLLFQGHKVVPWCTRCGTALSSHELAQGYKEVKDQSAYVKFKLKPGQKIGSWETGDRSYILAWTTTPWTLPGNVALAVGENIEYQSVQIKGDQVWYASESTMKELGHDGKKVKGKNLVGLEYEPLFDVEKLQNENSHKIYGASFVTTTDGTGVVHIAPMYGEDDYKLGIAMELPQYHTVSEDGRFVSGVPGLSGMIAKDHADSAKETEAKIFEILDKGGNLFDKKEYVHEYPFCWRCGTAVIYYARTSWFIGMSKLKQELLSRNAKINWIPQHIKDGRFGEWLREVKDWNLSRERYWGVPLPVWQCNQCHETKVIGGADELNKTQGGSRNEYLVMRHGQSEIQIKNIIDSGDHNFHLTKKGQIQVRATANKLRKEKIDLIIASPVLRTQETAEIVSKIIGVPFITDIRIQEFQLPSLSGKPVEAYDRNYPTYQSRFESTPRGGETLRDLRKRLAELVREMETKYQGKKILFITHEYPAWMFFHTNLGWSEKQAIREKEKMDAKKDGDFIEVAECMNLPYLLLPRDKNGQVDFHRPFIDSVTFPCEKCRGKMARIPEVADVWFDSGAMPFAQLHYPFENKDSVDKRTAYPADYIAEGMDQTRGWFYTLLATATVLGYPAPYKNVISLGLINDKNGQKRAKSKGNIVEPRSVINTYGVDAVRWYFYTATAAGEPKNFDEEEVKKATRRYHLVLLNSWVFYDTYGPKVRQPAKKIGKKKSVLDQWIVARLEEVIETATKKLDAYDIREAALSLEGFLDDFSRWYIRRSRRRLQPARQGLNGRGKPLSQSDYKEASETLGQVLYHLTLLTAPFTPFFGEYLYHQLEPKKTKDSVHFVDWPKLDKKLINKKLLKEMAEVRKVAAVVLAKRAELGIRVRQPLATLKLNPSVGEIRPAILEILRDEVNVKRVVYDKNLKEDIWLDEIITEELKEEGLIREMIRQIQDLRQKAGFKPRDAVKLFVEAEQDVCEIIKGQEQFIALEVKAKAIIFKKEFGATTESGGYPEGVTYLGVKKV
ncbi:MAG: class I tRNA ligase family protein [Patescibacteria group bacterium]